MNSKGTSNSIYAIVGKGGTGKTTFTTLFAKVLIEMRVHPLLIDADPTMSHLARSLGVDVKESIEEIREKVIRTAARRDSKENETIAEQIDQIVSDSMIRQEDFSLIVMGQPEKAGCFCPSNQLMRAIIEDISAEFGTVLIDCEAGMEQIQRKVIRSVDFLIIIADSSVRSIETAENILKTAKKFTNYKKIGLVLNKVQKHHEPLLERVNSSGIPLLGTIPFDEVLVKQEINGELIFDIPKKSAIYNAIEEISNIIIS
ncbi:MAG: AAA family ATPase [Candidatus Hodarchaeota archaeon]